MLKWLWEKLTPKTDQVTTAKFGIRRSLVAQINRACAQCGAKGVDNHGSPYEFCPSCGAKRPDPENLGEIWIKHL
jgi:hypothetical protein